MSAFFDWFAGFVDGEGCFYLRPSSGCRRVPVLSIEVRDDDLPILEEIVEQTGVGAINFRERRVGHRQACWRVTTKAGLERIVEILDAHPLRAKKKADYVIWRLAVRIYCASGGGNWDELDSLDERLREVRQYRSAA